MAALPRLRFGPPWRRCDFCLLDGSGQRQPADMGKSRKQLQLVLLRNQCHFMCELESTGSESGWMWVNHNCCRGYTKSVEVVTQEQDLKSMRWFQWDPRMWLLDPGRPARSPKGDILWEREHLG